MLEDWLTVIDWSRWPGWQAVSGLASAFAVLWAIRLANLEQKRSRARDVAFTGAALMILRLSNYPAHEIDGFAIELKAGSVNEGKIRTLLGEEGLRAIRDTIARTATLDLTRFPTSDLLKTFIFAHNSLGHFEKSYLAFMSGGPFSALVSDAAGYRVLFEDFRQLGHRFEKPILSHFTEPAQ